MESSTSAPIQEQVLESKKKTGREEAIVHQVEQSWHHWNNMTKLTMVASFLVFIFIIVLAFNAGSDSGSTTDNSVDNSVSPDNQAAWLIGAIAIVGIIVLGVIAFQFLKKGETISIVSKILEKASKNGKSLLKKATEDEGEEDLSRKNMENNENYDVRDGK